MSDKRAIPSFIDELQARRTIDRERIDLLFRRAPVALLTVVVNVGLLAWFLRQEHTHHEVISWAVALFVVTGARGAVLIARRRDVNNRSTLFWERLFAAGSFANGVGWGAAALFFIHGDLVSAVAVAFVVGGMVAGASSSTATSMASFLGFSVPALLPVIVGLLTDNESVRIVMGLMLLLFGVAMTLLARQGGQVITESIRLRLQNEAMTAELAHRSSERAGRLQLLLDYAGVVVVVASPKTGRIVDVTRNASAMFGLERDELVDGNLWRAGLIDSLATQQAWDRLVEGAQSDESTLVGTRVVDGVVQHIELVATSRSVNDVTYVLVVFKDVSERRSLETQLAQANLLAAVGTLAAGVAHEVNNPLSYIINNLELVRRAVQQSDEALEGESLLEPLDESIEGAKRISKIVADLTAAAGQNIDTDQEVDPVAVVKTCLRVAENEIRHRARITLDVEDTPSVRGDAVRINQVVLNILLNAAKAIPEGNAATNEIHVRLRHLRADNMVSIAIRDTGVGIPPAHMKRIFEPFFTSRRAAGGAGLGLSICHAVVTGLGGRIECESQEGEGATFTVLLPCAAPSASAPPRVATRQSDAGRLLRILIVDDDASVARSLRRGLRAHQVDVEHSATAALAKLTAHNDYDAILCDVMMPDLDGVDFYQQLRKRDPGAAERVVFLTGGAFTERTTAFLATVPNEVIKKPFDIDQVEATLRQVRASQATSPKAE